MKKLITLLLLFTLVGFLSGNQVVITNNYQYIVSEGKTYNFNNGSESNNVKYDRTNKIQIQNNKILADPLKYHYAFFWDEADSFIGYYKTNKGITTSGEYLGQVNTQSIPLPLNAYSFALVRYDNDYEVLPGITIEELFIDNNLDLSILHSTNNLYWKTDGNVSSLDNYYYAVGKNLLPFENSSFLNGQTLGDGSSLLIGSTFSITGNNITFTSTDNFKGLVVNFINLKPSTTYVVSFTGVVTGVNKPYIPGAYYYDSNQTFINANSGTFLDTFVRSFTTNSDTHFIRIDFLNDSPATSTITNIQFEQNTASTTFEAFIEPTISLNLTSLFGAGNEPNKTTMDGYYSEYEEYLEYLYVCCDIFATQTISFETIYFDDGVSTEIEAIGSILIFTIIGFTLMIFGFTSRRRLFNLLSIGAFVVLGFLLIEFVGFIVILFGLIFINVYYTFFGEL
jgi:hypothetical protein